MLDITYINNLIDNNITPSSQLTFDLYLTLLSLNNKHYQEKTFQNEINILEDFLRKTNNLKVKIQLRRKPNEIDNLLTEIKEIYNQNTLLIDKYNEDNIDIISVLETKEPTDITNIVDKLTKLKKEKLIKKEKSKELRDIIVNNIFNSEYIINNDTFNMLDISIPLDEFYKLFDYLLDPSNYQSVYHNEVANTSHMNIINSIIDNINNSEPLTSYIPVILTILFNKITNLNDINTTKFNIDNIKISDLYSFANYHADNTLKWKKVAIPNNYLFEKLKVSINSGMYYYNNNIFVLELTNDFKTSILLDDLIDFIKEIIKHI